MTGKSGKPPWSSHLKTKTTFDPGKESFGNCSLSEFDEEFNTLPRTFTSSMFILCLIERLSSFVEKDPVKNRKITELIVKQLQDLCLIDETCASPEFDDMRQRYRKALYTIVSMAHHLISGSPSSLQPVSRALDEVDVPCTTTRSRYASDFEILGFISKGGFGQVFQARNRLDGCKYAIKKIIVMPEDDTQQTILNEVTVLARLQHPNIVKYYTAWLEPASIHTVPSICILEDESSSLSDQKNQDNIAYNVSSGQTHPEQNLQSINSRTNANEDSSGSSYIVFRAEHEENHESHATGVRSNNGEVSSSCSSMSSEAPAEEESSESSGSVSENAAIIARKTCLRPGCAVLYIQMELCGRSLRQWLDWRPVEAEPSSMLGALQLRTRLSCFWQLVSALEYLHEQRIVHHDIKPSNIFVFGNHRLKLGDFGLACSYEASKGQVHHSVGTCTYAAPEQLKGGLCNFKSDIFSTGVVLLELLMPPFHTNSERIHVLSDLRESAIVPDIISKQMPHWGDLVCKLTNPDPRQRPTATDLKHQSEELMCQEPFSIQPRGDSVLEESYTSETIVSENSRSHTEVKTTDVFHRSDFKYLDGLSLEGMHEYHNTRYSKLSASHFYWHRNGVPVHHGDTINSVLLENEKLKTQLFERDFQIKLLQEQLRLLSLQLQN